MSAGLAYFNSRDIAYSFAVKFYNEFVIDRSMRIISVALEVITQPDNLESFSQWSLYSFICPSTNLISHSTYIISAWWAEQKTVYLFPWLLPRIRCARAHLYIMISIKDRTVGLHEKYIRGSPYRSLDLCVAGHLQQFCFVLSLQDDIYQYG